LKSNTKIIDENRTINYIREYVIGNNLKTQCFIFGIILSLLIMFPTNVYAEHIEAFAQYPDIVQLSSEKFIITIDDNSYNMYYGYHGSLDSMASDEPQPKLSSMTINQERKSLEITFDEILSNNVFWIKMPDEVISAEKGHFQLLIDGVETRYDLTRFPNDYALGMIIPKGGEHIVIIGTTVIPEFGTITMTILVVAIISIVVVTTKSRVITRF
jgi:predicted secreted protein with PEFG-CTERM motif